MLGFAGIVQSGNRSSLLLDTYSGAAAAYSLRRLRTAYTGSAVRVRRSTDSVEQDIGFDANGNLDESTLQTFCVENLVQRSEEFDNAYWTKDNLTITPNATTAPNGTSTADKFEETNSNLYKGIYNTNNINGLPASQVVVYSIYAKAAERSILQLTFFSGTITNNPRANFDLSNGILGTVDSGISAVISNAGNGWYRCSISATKANTDPIGAVVQTKLSSTATRFEAYQGVTGYGIYIWGAQLNTGSLKPYVQTTSAARDGMGYVTKWYDQSGNGRDAAQTTAGSQPRIVNAGVVEKIGAKASIFCNGTTNSFTTNSNTTSIRSIFSVNKSSKSTGFQNILRKNSQTASSLGPYIHRFDNSNFRSYAVTSSTILDSQTATTPTNYLLLSSIYDDTALRQFINGSVGNTASGANHVSFTSAIEIIGYNTSSSEYYQGYVSEIIAFDNNKFSTRTEIESNINTYYSIY